VLGLAVTTVALAGSRGHAFVSSAQAATTVFGRLIFALVAVGVLLVTFTGIHTAHGVTASGLVFAAALVGIGLALFVSDWRVRQVTPGWLLVAGGVLLSTALLVGLFPARPSQAALLFPGRLLGSPIWNPDCGCTSFNSLPSNASGVIRFVGTLVLVPVLIAMIANSAHRIRFLADAWIAGAALGGALGVLQYLGVLNSIELVHGAGVSVDSRVAGLTDHVDTLGIVSAMALPVAATRLGGCHGSARLWCSAAVMFLVAGIAVSGSRTGLVGGVVGVVIIAALHWEGRRGIKRTVVVGALFAAAIGTALTPSHLPVTERVLGTDPGAAISGQQHGVIYHAIWGEVLQRPVVGHGFQYVPTAHNTYLQLLHAGGIAALGAFLIFVFGTVTTGFRLGRSGTVSEPMRSLAQASVASLAVWFIVAANAQTLIFEPYLYIPVGIIIAILALERTTRSTSS
jgi:hypothetical protein